MATCASTCVITPPSWASACKNQKRTGGIPYLVVIACNFFFTDITDIAEWCDGVAASKIGLSPLIVGGKPVADFTKKRTDSCSPERPTGGSRKIDFTSFIMDNTATGARATQFTDIDFWNDLVENQEQYQAGYMDCSGRFFGVIEDFSIDASLVHDDNNMGNQFWQGTFSWNSLLEIKPYLIPNLLKALQSDPVVCP